MVFFAKQKDRKWMDQILGGRIIVSLTERWRCLSSSRNNNDDAAARTLALLQLWPRRGSPAPMGEAADKRFATSALSQHLRCTSAVSSKTKKKHLMLSVQVLDANQGTLSEITAVSINFSEQIIKMRIRKTSMETHLLFAICFSYHYTLLKLTHWGL